jgi:hypothetical protein
MKRVDEILSADLSGSVISPNISRYQVDIDTTAHHDNVYNSHLKVFVPNEACAIFHNPGMNSDVIQRNFNIGIWTPRPPQSMSSRGKLCVRNCADLVKIIVLGDNVGDK